MPDKFNARFLLIAMIISFSFCGYSQTGPAGVSLANGASNLVVWLKGETIAQADATNVTAWADQSGYVNSAVGVASHYPIYKVNILNGVFPVVRFTNTGVAGTIQYLKIPNGGGSIKPTLGVSVFIVGMMTAASGTWCPFLIRDADYAWVDGYGITRNNGTSGVYSYINTWNANFVNTALGYNTYSILDLNYDKVNVELFKTSTSAGTDPYAANITYVAPTTQSLFLGISPDNSGVVDNVQTSAALDGDISEAIVFNRALNVAERIIVENYLSAKYNLALTANDKYAGDGAGTGNYDFEVAGVGKEASGSNLSAASSISGGLDVTQSTVMENGEYLIYGHQTGNNALDAVDIGGMSAGPGVCRWNRIWYFDFTHVGGTAETVNLTFDLSDGGLPGVPSAPLSNYKLLYRAGLAGNWTEVMNASAIAGDRISFNGVAYNTVGDGYYTIGTLDNTISPLPIQLLSFTANAVSDFVQLDWSTATETNNDFFTIERSADGNIFVPIFDVDSRAPGGNSTSLINYTAFDEDPPTGTIYYRLKQTDFNGDSSYSNIISVDLDPPFSTNIFPNPSDGSELNISIRTERSRSVLVVVYDALGNITYSKVLPDQSGGEQVYALDVEGKLEAGVYFVVASSDDRMIKKKLIIR